MNQALAEAIRNRRSVYAIGKDIPVSEGDIRAIVEHAALYAPSAFNSQSGRVLLLFGAEHDRLWNMVKETLRAVVPAKSFPATERKIDGFGAGYGTALFFEDQSVVEGLQNSFPLYKDTFPVWSLQSSGMLQYIIWTMLEASGLGASLQHYNPLIDGQVQRLWSVPKSWKLLSQMPFGNVVQKPDAKETLPLEGRVKVFK